MNNPSPLIPQGSFEEQKNRNRSRVKIAIFFVLGIHGVGLLALLALGGCKKEADTTLTPDVRTNDVTPAFVEPTNTAAPPTPNTAGTSNTAVTPEPAPTPTPTPTPTLTPTPPPLTGGTEYKIAAGDNFSTIGKKFHVSAKAIAEANHGVDSTKLKIGQTIHIPMAPVAPAPGNTSELAPTPNAAGGEQTYTVKSNDNLSKIATQFHVSVKALRAANNLKTDRIKVGDKLKIPAKAPAPAPAAPATSPTEATPAR